VTPTLFSKGDNNVYVTGKKRSTPWAVLLEQKFIEWRAKQTARKAGIAQFAEFLGVSRDDLNNYMLRGVRISDENLERMAAKIGYEVYDAVGKDRPDPRFKAIKQTYYALPEDKKDVAERLLRELAESPVTGKGDGKHAPKKEPKPRPDG